jgi:hypothetical protein
MDFEQMYAPGVAVEWDAVEWDAAGATVRGTVDDPAEERPGYVRVRTAAGIGYVLPAGRVRRFSAEG